MGLFARLFGPKEDEHAEVRTLWHAVVARARDPRWYAQLGVADSLPGRFDAITIVLAQAVDRNVTMVEGAQAAAVADEMRRLAAALAEVPEARLLAGELPA